MTAVVETKKDHFLNVGQIVVNTDQERAAHQRRHGLEPQRGIVIYARGKGARPWGTPFVGENTHIIQVSAGTRAVTDNQDGHWQVVPDEERTTRERVWSEMLSWVPLELDDGVDHADSDSLEYQMLMAMLTPAAQERAMSFDWPTLGELWLVVADSIDARVQEARTLGSATARLE